MNIESELKKDGIEIVGRLDTLSVNTLAKNISEKICKAFPKAHFVATKLFIEISRIPMYLAKIPEGYAEATYFYKNSSIYFKQGLSLDELEKFAIHEFIHHLQEVKDKKNVLIRLGLCDYTEFKTYGAALNEGAVQLLTSQILEQQEEIVKYYGISLPTISPNYYPLLCNLVQQLTYLVGTDSLYESTFFSTDEFKLEAIGAFGKKNFFRIEDNLDQILNIEEKIIKLNQSLISDSCNGLKAQKISNKISSLKESLKLAFVQTQNKIFTSYFNNEYNKLTTTESIEMYRSKLYNYKNYIGIIDNYYDFNNFYIDKMSTLEDRYDAILNNTALVTVRTSKLHNLLKSIKSFLSLQKENILK